jgi:hypothetical protein
LSLNQSPKYAGIDPDRFERKTRSTCDYQTEIEKPTSDLRSLTAALKRFKRSPEPLFLWSNSMLIAYLAC